MFLLRAEIETMRFNMLRIVRGTQWQHDKDNEEKYISRN